VPIDSPGTVDRVAGDYATKGTIHTDLLAEDSVDWEALELPQIVGHTRCANPTQKGRSYCIDFAQAAYAIVENGDVQLNIWPDSWLGREMLDSV